MARTRLTPERENELYTAVLDLLGEVGYEALTMDAVAARTRSSKATLYRQWGSKAELVVRALRNNKPVHLAEVDTGSLRGDFQAVLALSDDCQMEKNSALLRGLSHAVHTNPDLFQALRGLLIEPEMTGLAKLLQRAVDRGEVRRDNPALSYVPHMMIGAFAARELVEERPVDRQFLIDYAESVVFPALGV
ncbi:MULTISPECIES: TetR/AcrR family transcriptional regulator [unclassified Streptomyces]|uniref:TetR/AcrR family transcriptional regulator n=1 Tax=Streptomyces TaxID=1883 RepID=UPI0001C194C4|nr:MULTISPECIES: TetR/AcrR family transcriptional regulator [unclassified Streptomyces]MYR70053.1 TetR family transcriptional regulator [Streptomyces sp. SID4939]MYS03064.1 TetR family transcriptional regulator [Streptomyces sp. SID4940]MYT62297.1 TetR family transcriptional regulator [Streptomyces sp. SID8357]MYT83907.1 TetR family transcriptional regulator [Streptomyces sp. SID8360]MYU36936.1 TetR family transcriptional regulator [Streptomyces sp. SID8358]MYW37986.1 TetR family transcriptio